MFGLYLNHAHMHTEYGQESKQVWILVLTSQSHTHVSLITTRSQTNHDTVFKQCNYS